MGKKQMFRCLYSVKFKIDAILDMRRNSLSYEDAARKYWPELTSEKAHNHAKSLREWEQIYLAEGEKGIMARTKVPGGKGKKRENNPPSPGQTGRKEKKREKAPPSPGQSTREELIARVQYLEMENAYLKKTQGLDSCERESKTAKTQIIRELRPQFPLDGLLKLAGLSKSTYFYHLRAMKKEDKYASLRLQIKSIFEDNHERYGYRRIHAALRNAGHVINRKTVQKLMQEMHLQGKQKIRGGRYSSDHGVVGTIAGNHLNRNFKAERPFEKLVTDVTEFKVCDRKVYLSPVMDLFNSEIVAYSISERPNFAQIKTMMEGLFAVLPPDAKAMLHSDQGWQYQMKEYQQMLKDHHIIQSMSRRGNCLDNSVMENFFGRLKVEMFFGEHFESVEDFIGKLEEYICYFNNERISLKRKGMSPVQYKIHSLYH